MAQLDQAALVAAHGVEEPFARLGELAGAALQLGA
jgi:hypothetical protein